MGTTICPHGYTDTLYKYVCNSGSNYCDLSNPSSWGWQKEPFAYNPCKNSYCGSDPDHYAEPSYVYANGKHFIFFTNPNGDYSSAKGRISFRYSTDGINWSSDYILLIIADENIKTCNCRGGFARPAAIFMNGYFFLYFEVWREYTFPTKPDCCPTGIGN